MVRLSLLGNWLVCLERQGVCVKDEWITKRLTALEITPPDSARVEQPFTQGKALSLAYATLHALTAPAREALFPVSPSPVEEPSMRKTLPNRLTPPRVLRFCRISDASGAGVLKYSVTHRHELTWK